MERKVTEVKGKRRYDSSGRQAQAQRSREAVLVSAERQFLDTGYAATTIAAIAREAGVSVETIYKAFGGKSGLVRAIYERRLAGRGAVPAFQRSDAMRARETDPRAIMRNWGELAAEVSALVFPIRRLMRSAAVTDPDMAALLKDGDDERAERMRHHAQFLAERGYLRPDVTVAEAADIMWACTSDALHELLVTVRGWSWPRFARFIGDFLIASLLPGHDTSNGDLREAPGP